MKSKINIFTEIAYVIGMICIAAGTGFITKANFGVGVVVAPACVIHKYLTSLGLTFFTFGVCQYLFQGFLIILVSVVCRRFKKSYLFAFVSAVIQGYLLDASLMVIPDVDNMYQRVILFILGQLVLSVGISFMVNTYITPEAYEVAVLEFVDKFAPVNIHYYLSTVKTIYDCSSGVLAIALSFIFFGMWNFVGIGIGTIVSALISGWLIGAFSKLQDCLFIYRDAFKFRKYFPAVEIH